MLEKQKEVLKNQITDLNKAKLMCEKMLDEESISYEKIQVEQYVTDLHDYWKDNRTVFKLDSVSFLYIWGSMLTWTMRTAAMRQKLHILANKRTAVAWFIGFYVAGIRLRY